MVLLLYMRTKVHFHFLIRESLPKVNANFTISYPQIHICFTKQDDIKLNNKSEHCSQAFNLSCKAENTVLKLVSLAGKFIDYQCLLGYYTEHGHSFEMHS